MCARVLAFVGRIQLCYAMRRWDDCTLHSSFDQTQTEPSRERERWLLWGGVNIFVWQWINEKKLQNKPHFHLCSAFYVHASAHVEWIDQPHDAIAIWTYFNHLPTWRSARTNECTKIIYWMIDAIRSFLFICLSDWNASHVSRGHSTST